MNRYHERRREPQPEHYNDDPSAHYTRSLDQHYPYTRSSQVIIEPLSESSSPAAILGERIATILGVVTIIAVTVALATGWCP